MNWDDPYDQLKHIVLKRRLGLELAEDDVAFAGDMSLEMDFDFTREEVIALLGDGERGIPRMLPVDIALGRLGMPIVRAHPDGTAERLTKDFPKAWAARIKSDRAIATYVAKTYAEVPKGWYPDAERLQMSDAEAAGDELSALGPAGRAAVATVAPYFRFDLVPRELRIAGYQMWQRRRLAGIAPFACEGLVHGFWDDVMSGYDVAALCWRGLDATMLAVRLAAARDVCLAAAAAGASGAEPWSVQSGLYGGINLRLVDVVSRDDLGEPDPDKRALGPGFAELYRRLKAGPGAVWSDRPVRERPERTIGVTFGMRVLENRDRADPGDLVVEQGFDWVPAFASA